jgi:hypothetical protein
VCPLDHRCMRSLTPAEVYTAAVQLLGPRSVSLSHRSRNGAETCG